MYVYLFLNSALKPYQDYQHLDIVQICLSKTYLMCEEAFSLKTKLLLDL